MGVPTTARRRSRPLVASLACLFGVVVLGPPALAGQGAGTTAAAAGLAAPAVAPPPVPPIASVVDMGLVRQNANVNCRDGSYSALVGKVSVWAFGDTCLAKGGVLGDQFIDNTLAGTKDLNASDGIALNIDKKDSKGVPVRVLPFTANEIAFNASHAPNEIALWPGQIVPDPARNRVLMFYASVYRGSDIGFTGVGGGIAVANPTFTKVTRPVQNPDPSVPEPTYLWNGDEQPYTGGYLLVGDMLYCYGGSPNWLYTNVHVARVPLADALDATKWRYWNGTQWSTENDNLATVYRGGAAGDTLFYDEYLGAYVTVYQTYLDNNVYYRVADSPIGPWSEQALMFTAEQGTDPSYAARVHPEFAEGNGRTQYITYVKNTALFHQEHVLTKVTFGAP